MFSYGLVPLNSDVVGVKIHTIKKNNLNSVSIVSWNGVIFVEQSCNNWSKEEPFGHVKLHDCHMKLNDDWAAVAQFYSRDIICIPIFLPHSYLKKVTWKSQKSCVNHAKMPRCTWKMRGILPLFKANIPLCCVIIAWWCMIFSWCLAKLFMEIFIKGHCKRIFKMAKIYILLHDSLWKMQANGAEASCKKSLFSPIFVWKQLPL